jgi:Tfp pilus assembly PilM family ATPase
MSTSTASESRASKPAPTARRNWIGLEAGGGRLRYALRRGRQGAFSVGTMCLETPGETLDAHALRARARRAGLPTGPAVCTLASPAIDIFPLHLPPGAPAALASQVVAQAQAQISYPLAEAVLDYSLLPEGARRPVSGTVPVLVYAAPLASITNLLRRFEMIGLPVERLLTPAGVLAPRIDAASLEARHLLVATGEEATSVSVVQHGAVLLERILPWGITPLVDRLHTELNLPKDQCRALLGGDGPAEPGEAAADLALEGTLQEILGPAFSSLAGETAGCLGYCDSFLHHEPVASVVLCGPLEGYRFLREVLARELELPVRRALEALRLPGPARSPDAGVYATSICCALWEEEVDG